MIITAFFLAYFFRDFFIRGASTVGLSAAQTLRVLAPVQDYFVILAFALLLFNAALSALGAYRSMRLSSYPQIARMMLSAGAVVFLSLGALLYITKIDLSRSFVALFCGLSAVLLFAERLLVLSILRVVRARGKNFRNVLIVGSGEQALSIYRQIVAEPEMGLRVVGFVSLQLQSAVIESSLAANAMFSSGVFEGGYSSSDEEVLELPLPVIANVETFESALKIHAIDEVIFTDVKRAFALIEDLAEIASDEGVGVSLAADFFSLEILRSEVSYFGDTPLIHYQRVPGDVIALSLKRVIDIGCSSVLLVIFAVPFALLALFIRSDSRGPVFFRQERVGLNGRRFTLYKFRSMVVDAEEQLPKLRDRNEMTGPVFKMKHDPRVTRIGRLLRKFSIDELPQLWNVFKGEMSLVGPRPPLPSEVKLYARKQRRRLSMRPGITCTWQVSGRNDIPNFEEWARLDLEYIDTWSLKKDIALLLKTIPAVLIGSGAR